MSKEDTIQHILTVFQTSGGEIYGAEAVTQLEHALQAASLARDSGACRCCAIARYRPSVRR